MIPKRIHYCWFGGRPLPRRVHQCISSWRRQCPDYRYLLWTEENFHRATHPFVQWCIEHAQQTLLEEYMCLWLVYQYGGLYLNTDCELVRPPDALLKNGAFFAFGKKDEIALPLGFGAQAKHPAVKAMLKQYEQLQQQAEIQTVRATQMNTAALLSFGLCADGTRQHIADIEILPQDWFDPYDADSGRLCMTRNTVSIRWYSKDRPPQNITLYSKLTRPFQQAFVMG